MKNEAISLGWNCTSAIYGKNNNYRSSKNDGYLTCPFDIMATNYYGIIECIKDDFDLLCDDKYLKLYKIDKKSKWFNFSGDGDEIIINTKYKFIFNHESPNHSNLHITEKWEKGKNHYIINNFENFKIRYKKRIENIKYYLNSNEYNINFILYYPNISNKNDIKLLDDLIKIKYPKLKYDYIFINMDDENKQIYNEHLDIMMNLN